MKVINIYNRSITTIPLVSTQYICAHGQLVQTSTVKQLKSASYIYGDDCIHCKTQDANERKGNHVTKINSEQ